MVPWAFLASTSRQPARPGREGGRGCERGCGGVGVWVWWSWWSWAWQEAKIQAHGAPSALGPPLAHLRNFLLFSLLPWQPKTHTLDLHLLSFYFSHLVHNPGSPMQQLQRPVHHTFLTLSRIQRPKAQRKVAPTTNTNYVRSPKTRGGEPLYFFLSLRVGERDIPVPDWPFLKNRHKSPWPRGPGRATLRGSFFVMFYPTSNMTCCLLLCCPVPSRKKDRTHHTQQGRYTLLLQ